MLYAFKPQNNSLPINEFSQNFNGHEDDFFTKLNYINKKTNYISSVEYFNIINDESVDLFFEIYYSQDGSFIDFIILQIDDIRVFKNLDLLHKFTVILNNLFVTGEKWNIYDLWADKKLDNSEILIDSIKEYALHYNEYVNSDNSNVFQKILNFSKDNQAQILKIIFTQKETFLKKYFLNLLLNYQQTVNFNPEIKLNLDPNFDIDEKILIQMILSDARQHKELTQFQKDIELKILSRKNLPPDAYISLAYYYAEIKDYKNLYDICMLGYKKYRLNEIHDVYNQYKNHFSFKQRLNFGFEAQGWLIGLSFLQYYLPFFVLFNLPILINIVTDIVQIVPVVLNSQTISYIINENTLFSVPAALFVGFSMLALIFTIINAAFGNNTDTNYFRTEKSKRMLFVSALSVVVLSTLCNLIPAIVFATQSISYINTDTIYGNSTLTQINNIHSIKINILEPERGLNQCPFITDTPTQCSYRYSISVLEKDTKERTVFSGYICSSDLCSKSFILNDKTKTEAFVRVLKSHRIPVSINYGVSEIDVLPIPDSFKETFKLLQS